MSEYNDTNIGIGTAYDTPEEKEIERLNQRLRTKDAISTDQAHEIYRLGLKLSAVEHERDALTTSLQSAKEERDNARRIVKEITDTFYGQNLRLENWHRNGDLEPVDRFFEENNWSIEETPS